MTLWWFHCIFYVWWFANKTFLYSTSTHNKCVIFIFIQLNLLSVFYVLKIGQFRFKIFCTVFFSILFRSFLYIGVCGDLISSFFCFYFLLQLFLLFIIIAGILYFVINVVYHKVFTFSFNYNVTNVVIMTVVL